MRRPRRRDPPSAPGCGRPRGSKRDRDRSGRPPRASTVPSRRASRKGPAVSATSPGSRRVPETPCLAAPGRSTAWNARRRGTGDESGAGHAPTRGVDDVNGHAENGSGQARLRSSDGGGVWAGDGRGVSGEEGSGPLRRVRRAEAMTAGEGASLDRRHRGTTMQRPLPPRPRPAATRAIGTGPASPWPTSRALGCWGRFDRRRAYGAATSARRRRMVAEHDPIARTVRAPPQPRQLFEAANRSAPNLFADLDVRIAMRGVRDAHE